MEPSEAAAEYIALRAANDRLRVSGLQWFWDALQETTAQENSASPVMLQTARQEWKFNVGKSVMVGERFGVRFRGKTLLIELGWPREPEHGFVPGNGLARGQVSFSLSPILAEQVVDELILKPGSNSEPVWFTFVNGKPEVEVTRERIRGYLRKLQDD